VSFIEIIRSVLLNLRANKFRVFLTSLGIIIGSFTIIMVVGIAKGSEKAVSDQFKRLSVETIIIKKGKNYKGSKELTLDKALKMTELSNVREVGAILSTATGVSFGAATENMTVSGITESYHYMSHMNIEEGEYISDKDGLKREKVVVLGNNIAATLFKEDINEAVGKQITIKGRKYRVKGILKRMGDAGTGAMSVDDGVFIPYAVAQKYIAGKKPNPTVIVQAMDINTVAPAIEEITKYIKGVTGVDEAYTVTDAGNRLTSAKETARTMSALLIAVATIVLIVGGIGIMNVLLVSVKERTREIGILKSIGARRSDILLEFLLEAIVISIGGGLIGSVLGFSAMPIMRYANLQVIASIEGILLGLLFSVITGTFFGYYPALKASKLKPIDALNHE
jgi:putative ABC transport system permease protein